MTNPKRITEDLLDDALKNKIGGGSGVIYSPVNPLTSHHVYDSINNRPLGESLISLANMEQNFISYNDVVEIEGYLYDYISNVQATIQDFSAVSYLQTYANHTLALNAAISQCSTNGGGVLRIPPGTYQIDGWKAGSVNDYPTGGVLLRDNVTLDLRGVTLKAIPNNKDHYTVLNLTNCKNVRIIGGTVVGERYEHTKSPTYDSSGMADQWGYGIAICGSSNIIVDGTLCKDFMGDGFYIGSNASGVTSADIHLRHVVADNNRRNGLSITSLYNGSIINSVFKNTNGQAPECGVDIEPNPGRTISGLIIDGCHALGNNQHGFLFASIQTDTPSGYSCIVTNSVARYNKLSGFYTNRAHSNLFANNYALENLNNGFALLESHHVQFLNNVSDKNNFNGVMVGYCEYGMFHNNSAKGNSQATHNAHDQFNFFSSHRNSIQSNTGRHMALTKKARYGVYIASDCVNNFVTNNDMMDSCVSGGGINNASSSTVKGAGNRGNTGTFGTGDWL